MWPETREEVGRDGWRPDRSGRKAHTTGQAYAPACAWGMFMAWFWSKRTRKQPGETTGLSPERLFELLSPSIVTVECLNREGQLVQFGSGVVTAPASVVTNKHVVDKGDILKVKTPRRVWSAEITHLHPDHDLCRLLVKGLSAPPIPLGISSRVRVGERVFAIGSRK